MNLNPGKKALLGACAAVLAMTASFAACGDDDNDANTQHSAVISAIEILDRAGLHGIDESINNDEEIPPTTRTTALKLQTVLELTDWPGELQDAAEDLARTMGDLAAAVDGENPDLARAGELAKKAHDDQHDFSHDVWAWLQSEAGIEGAGGGHGS